MKACRHQLIVPKLQISEKVELIYVVGDRGMWGSMIAYAR